MIEVSAHHHPLYPNPARKKDRDLKHNPGDAITPESKVQMILFHCFVIALLGVYAVIY